MFILFFTCYFLPMLFILMCGLLTDAQEDTMQIAVPIAFMPGVNLLATIGCLSVTIRTTVDWFNR
ncbi:MULTISPECIES: hypothetical protein [Spirosoma]|uniref:Uncharacterized protein n=1 Tax=Spirosoma liriopis TaxID=2937440 RepID=A0ABT0HP79_9BACT|nr:MULTISPECIES: hypothetical protein [Spirosoma]MCK8493974.1 hypothetical protein [Spirosoma liriopis]UHG88995.1 hypothetical protein LQ777_12125 [Spirosoma oryzicola]